MGRFSVSSPWVGDRDSILFSPSIDSAQSFSRGGAERDGSGAVSCRLRCRSALLPVFPLPVVFFGTRAVVFVRGGRALLCFRSFRRLAFFLKKSSLAQLPSESSLPWHPAPPARRCHRNPRSSGIQRLRPATATKILAPGASSASGRRHPHLPHKHYPPAPIRPGKPANGGGPHTPPCSGRALVDGDDSSATPRTFAARAVGRSVDAVVVPLSDPLAEDRGKASKRDATGSRAPGRWAADGVDASTSEAHPWRFLDGQLWWCSL